MSAPRLIVIGAGPIGIAAALGALRRGLDVRILEAEGVGSSLLRWGPTRFFSPLSMNLPLDAPRILGSALPPADAILTGPEFARKILTPLANSSELAGRISTGHRVRAVGRSGLTRFDFCGHPVRHERAFRLLVDTPQGEQNFEAEYVIDASGVYGVPAALGSGGLPAVGEGSCNHAIIRDLGALHARIKHLRGRRILLVGHGHSAANAILSLNQLVESKPETHVVWATRSLNRRPCVQVASDPLPERQNVVSHANTLALNPPSWLQMERKASIERIQSEENEGCRVALGGGRVVVVDNIVALTGYRPDLTFLSELAIRIAPDTEGATGLTRALSNVTDCLATPSIAPADLDSGEPGFYLAGAKSYGRARTFLLKNGYTQVELMLDRLVAGY